MKGGWLLWLVVVPPLAWGEEGGAWQELGRLFTTPETRAKLEQLRQDARRPPPSTQQTPSEEPAEAITNPPLVAVRGMIQSSHGQKVIWMDDSNTLEETLTRNKVQVRVRESRRDAIVFSLPTDPTAIYKLKPGQVLDTRTRQIHEGYNAPDPVAEESPPMPDGDKPAPGPDQTPPRQP